MIARWIGDWADRTPLKPALVYNDQVWTYSEFARRIALARGWLARQRLTGPGLAAVANRNVAEAWVWSLALRTLGWTTIGLRSGDDLAALSGAALVIAAPDDPAWSRLPAACAAEGARLVSAGLGDAGPALDLRDGPALAPGGHILQTSGTTGAHKQVLFDPAFEDAFFRARRASSGVDHDSVVLVFDFGGWTGVGYKSPAGAWQAGATVVMWQGPPPHLALRHPGLTHASLVPTVLEAILAAPEGAFARQPRLRLAITGGSITQHQIDETRRRITPQFFNVLGATEVATFGFTPLQTPDDHRWHRIADGVRVEVVDDEDRPVPVDVIGRVRVGAEGGPTSYRDDPEATAACFRDGFFYPGDLGVVRADGRLALMGRVTDVINVSGQKISPAPIEDRLCERLGVSGVCLFSMQDEAGEEQLHLVVEGVDAIDVEPVRPLLRAWLRSIAQVRVHFVPRLPRNAMGKVVRARMPLAIAAASGVRAAGGLVDFKGGAA